MAITGLDPSIAGEKPLEHFSKAASGTLVAGRPFTPFYTNGMPGAAVAPAPGLAGAALTTYAGQIPVPPASNNTHLSGFIGVSSGTGGILMLCDRLWHNSGINVTLTTAQTINSVAWPARDKNASINGAGVYVGVEVSAATGAGTPNLTLGYTDSDGNAGATATSAVSTVASSAVGTFYPISLAPGDVGVRSIQNFTLSATWTSGTIHLVAYRVISIVPLVNNGIPGSLNAVTGNMPRLYDNSVPFLLFYPQGTSTSLLAGSVKYTQG
jgi:hypothetical protein